MTIRMIRGEIGASAVCHCPSGHRGIIVIVLRLSGVTAFLDRFMKSRVTGSTERLRTLATVKEDSRLIAVRAQGHGGIEDYRGKRHDRADEMRSEQSRREYTVHVV
jgi:hypothetical protein